MQSIDQLIIRIAVIQLNPLCNEIKSDSAYGCCTFFQQIDQYVPFRDII